MTARPLVTVVVVNWNGYEDTRRCLRSLGALEYEPLHVVVVDNGSTDGSAARIESEFADVELVRSPRNLGFAGGANLGIRAGLQRGSEFVWLLNNDAEVEPRTLEALVAEAQRDERTGVVGGVVFGRDGRVHTWGGGTVSRLGIATLVEARPARPLDYVTGACMLLRRRLLEEVGLLDDTFFFYFEDADLCRRARAAGWKLAVAHDARIVHAVGATVERGATSGRSERADLLQVESGGVFVGKHFRPAWPLAAARLLGVAANRLARRQPRRIRALAVALVRGVRRGKQRAVA